MESLSTTLGNRTNQINQIKKNTNNQINQISYRTVKRMIFDIPFNVNASFHALIAWQIRRVGVKRFAECVDAAKRADTPERYLMACLKNEK